MTWVRGAGICGRVLGGRLVHREDAEGLQAAGPGQRLDDDAGAFIGRLVAVAPQAGHVQQHVGPAVVGDDEAEALGDVEPLDGTDDLDDIEAGLGRTVGARLLACALDLSDGAPDLVTARHVNLAPMPQAFSYSPRRYAGYATRLTHSVRFSRKLRSVYDFVWAYCTCDAKLLRVAATGR